MIKQRNVTVKTDTATLTYAEMGDILCNKATAMEVTLPTASQGLWYRVININDGAVTVGSYTLSNGEELFCISNSATWQYRKSISTHGIDSTTYHTGVSGATENNFISFDANGLPKDSGHKDADYDDVGTAAGAISTHESTYTHADIASNTSARHTRAHDVTSSSDHNASTEGDKGKILKANESTGTMELSGDLATGHTVGGAYIYRAGGTDVPVTDGGTGASTQTTAFDNLSPMTTQGDIIYGDTSGTGTRLAKGGAGNILGMGASVPEWRPYKLSTNTTYYVRKDGSDSNTGLADNAGGAFLTMGKAISMIPQILNATLNIYPDNGDYSAEGVLTVEGVHGTGKLSFSGYTYDDTTTIGKIVFKNCHVTLEVENLTVATTGGNSFTFDDCPSATLDYGYAPSGAGVGFYILNNSSVVCSYCEAASKTYGMKVDRYSYAYISGFTAGSTGSTVGIYAANYSYVYTDGSLAGTTPFIANYNSLIDDNSGVWDMGGSTTNPYKFGGLITATRTPASTAADGVAGTICWDSGYIYVCVATNTWKRAEIATW